MNYLEALKENTADLPMDETYIVYDYDKT